MNLNIRFLLEKFNNIRLKSKIWRLMSEMLLIKSYCSSINIKTGTNNLRKFCDCILK